jgi:hypothetical protein
MSPAEAHRAVASELSKLGVKPAKGTGQIRARTVRDWCDRVSAGRPLLRHPLAPDSESGRQWYGRAGLEELGLVTATVNAASLLTEEQRARIKGLPTNAGRRFALAALANSIRTMKLGDAN